MKEIVVRDKSFSTKDGRHFPLIHKVKFGPKSLTFFEQGRETTITFQKKRHEGEDYLEIQTHKKIEIETKKRCDLGCEHIVKEKVTSEYGWAYMDWEHVQNLIEWLQLGSWGEIKK